MLLGSHTHKEKPKSATWDSASSPFLGMSLPQKIHQHRHKKLKSVHFCLCHFMTSAFKKKTEKSGYICHQMSLKLHFYSTASFLKGKIHNSVTQMLKTASLFACWDVSLFSLHHHRPSLSQTPIWNQIYYSTQICGFSLYQMMSDFKIYQFYSLNKLQACYIDIKHFTHALLRCPIKKTKKKRKKYQLNLSYFM